MSSVRHLPIGIKLGAVGCALSLFVVLGLWLFAKTYEPIVDRAQDEARAHA